MSWNLCVRNAYFIVIWICVFNVYMLFKCIGIYIFKRRISYVYESMCSTCVCICYSHVLESIIHIYWNLFNQKCVFHMNLNMFAQCVCACHAHVLELLCETRVFHKYFNKLIERNPPPGGFPIYYVPWSRTVCKRTPLEEPGTNPSRGVLSRFLMREHSK